MTKNRDLLKEAIADAKLLKATAIENAKSALQETFTPHLKEMFEKKINEMEDEDEDVELEVENIFEEEETETEETETEETEESTEETETEEEEEEFNIEDMTEEELKEFVEETIKDMAEAGELEPTEEIPSTDLEVDDNELDFSIEGDDDEEVDVDELINELKRSKMRRRPLKENKRRKVFTPKRKPAPALAENLKLKRELRSSQNAIKQLNEQLKEINLLNAKLLYTNKLFKAHTLNESQKVKVLNQFDKASNVKEVKLIFETLKTQISKPTRKPIKENLGYASKPIIKPKGNIKESQNSGVDAELKNRWRKLAGL